MAAFVASASIGFRAATRSPAVRATTVAGCMLAALSRDLAAFAFSDEAALSRAGVLGTAHLLALLAAMVGGMALRAEPGRSPGFASLLVGHQSAGIVFAGSCAGVTAASLIISTICIVIGTFSTGTIHLLGEPAALWTLVVITAWSAAAAATGLHLTTHFSPPVAWILGLTVIFGVPALQAFLPDAAVSALPTLEAVFPARDAAFGSLTPAVAILSALAGLMAAAAITAANLALLRAKEIVAPPPLP